MTVVNLSHGKQSDRNLADQAQQLLMMQRFRGQLLTANDNITTVRALDVFFMYSKQGNFFAHQNTAVG